VTETSFVLQPASTFLATKAFTGLDTFSNSKTVAVAAPYALVEEYLIDLAANAVKGKVLSTGNVTATAPEPSTWAMMPLGFAGPRVRSVPKG
jgi:hypothetical protein